MAAAIAAGLRALGDDPLRRAVAGSACLLYLFGAVHATLYVLYVTRDLAVPPVVLGMVLGARGLCAVPAAALTRRVAGRVGAGAALIASLALCALANALVPAAPLVAVGLASGGGGREVEVALLVANQALFGVGSTLFQITAVSLLQTATPDRLLGRVMATLGVLTRGAHPFGSLLGGVLGEVVGLAPTLLLGALGIAGAAGWLLLSPVRGLREPPAPATELAPAAP